MGTSTLKGPFSAADLMVALHLIDVNKKDKETMVPAVKKAIDQCFKERRNLHSRGVEYCVAATSRRGSNSILYDEDHHPVVEILSENGRIYHEPSFKN